MSSEEDLDWLVRVYEEQGATLHRLVVLLDAEDQSGRIVRSALLALHRRGHRLIDPAERVEFLHEHVVHLAHAVRPAQSPIQLPEVAEARQQEILRAISAMPPRMAELLIVSHYLSVFGPDLAGIMRMSVRGCNQRLEVALETLRANVGDPAPGSIPGVLESLSQEVTAALRSAARLVQAPGTDTLEGELRNLTSLRTSGLGPKMVALITLVAVLSGLGLAALTRPTAATTETGSPAPAVSPTAVAAASMPAQVRDVPLYYVDRQDGNLFQELRDLPASPNLVEGALTALLTLAPLDPDYESAWGPGQLIGTEVSEEALIVDLSSDAFTGLTSPELAARARNQVVYTASEIMGDPELRVQFLSDGGPPPAEFVSETGFTRTGLGPMPSLWITSPKNAAQLAAGPVVIVGTVKPGWGVPVVRISDIDTDEVVAETSAQTSTGVNSDGWRVWSVSLQLPPGDYDLRASVRGGTPPAVSSENKSIRVR